MSEDWVGNSGALTGLKGSVDPDVLTPVTLKILSLWGESSWKEPEQWPLWLNIKMFLDKGPMFGTRARAELGTEAKLWVKGQEDEQPEGSAEPIKEMGNKYREKLGR